MLYDSAGRQIASTADIIVTDARSLAAQSLEPPCPHNAAERHDCRSQTDNLCEDTVASRAEVTVAHGGRAAASETTEHLNEISNRFEVEVRRRGA